MHAARLIIHPLLTFAPMSSLVSTPEGILFAGSSKTAGCRKFTRCPLGKPLDLECGLQMTISTGQGARSENSSNNLKEY